nr:hypothetical protein [Tanacetum cinerariifolium]
ARPAGAGACAGHHARPQARPGPRLRTRSRAHWPAARPQAELQQGESHFCPPLPALCLRAARAAPGAYPARRWPAAVSGSRWAVTPLLSAA